MKPIFERIDTRPKEDPIPQTDRKWIDGGGDWGDWGGGWDKEKLIEETQKELIEILEK